MDSEQWKQLDKLLHAALERPPEERDAFLREACAGDERLEREARSLLTLEQKAEGFLETPAIEMAAQVAVREQSDDSEETACSARARSFPITGSWENSAAAEWASSTRPRTSNWAAPWL